jgi:flagellar basal-body rod modification protein FlgD
MTSLVSFVSAGNYNLGGDGAAQASLSSNFDTFISILTAQIQNQDPLEPTDSSKFTEQLVQFSGVEQQIRSNKLLESVFNATIGNAGAALSGYLGQTALINASGAQFAGDPVSWQYTLPADAADATVTVTDAKGKVLWSQAAEKTAGAHDFTWDGQLFNGETAADGVYYINVVARDANDNPIEPAHALMAQVTGIDLTHGEPAITTAAGIFGYSDILRVMQQ